jgi:hypothetical protein
MAGVIEKLWKGQEFRFLNSATVIIVREGSNNKKIKISDFSQSSCAGCSVRVRVVFTEQESSLGN